MNTPLTRLLPASLFYLLAVPALAVDPAALEEEFARYSPMAAEEQHNEAAAESQECRERDGRSPQGFCFDAWFATAHDGTRIDMTVYVPGEDQLRSIARNGRGPAISSRQPGYAPLLLHSHGFGGSKQANLEQPGAMAGEQAARDLWHSGYFVISFSQRGFGASGDEIGMMDPKLEGLDSNEVVDWAIKHLREGIYDFKFDDNNPEHISSMMSDADCEGRDASGNCARSLLMNDDGMRMTGQNPDPALGATGYSYGGGYQYTASHAAQLMGFQRFDALNPQGTWNDLRYSLAQHDVPKTGWVNIMTAFALDGSRRPLPRLLLQARAEADVLNRVRGETSMTFLRNSPIGYCADGTNFDGEMIQRTRGVDVFHIQGLQDTLFNFNEGYDNVQCIRDGDPGADVRLLAVTGGHLLPAISPANHSGNTGMSIDEVVWCDGQRFSVREAIKAWFEEKLRGQRGAADFVPNACIVQENLDPAVMLDGDPDFHREAGFDPAIPNFGKHRFAREGVSYDSIDDIPLGGQSHEFSTELAMGPIGTSSFVPLYTAEEPGVMAGIPLLKLRAEPPHPDTVFFLGIGVRRGEAAGVDPLRERTGGLSNSVLGEWVNEFDRQQAANGGAQGSNDVELLHAQLLAVRSNVYPYESRSQLEGQERTLYGELVDANGEPLWFGCAPNEAGCDWGRMVGISTRLNPGDQVGLYFFGSHLQYASNSPRFPGVALIEGEAQLPEFLPRELAPYENPALQ